MTEENEDDIIPEMFPQTIAGNSFVPGRITFEEYIDSLCDYIGAIQDDYLDHDYSSEVMGVSDIAYM